ncbi:uncharacterized protein [Dysidea avara]|uniref:uncharacterized protein isoform X2 n=1 Tax=Dysidea avara TaxID=196820 RepID=UPI00331D03AA
MAKINANCRPTIKELQSTGIILEVSPKWYDLGVELLNDNQVGQLKVIEKNNSGDVQNGCREMFRYWLQSHPDANWHTLADALKEINKITTATNLEKRFSASTTQSTSSTTTTPSAAVSSHSSVETSAKADAVSTATVQKTPTTASTDRLKMFADRRPEMWDLIKVVVPKIRPYWKDVAYSMGYDPHAIKAIQLESYDLKDSCRKLFENWLSTSHGPNPKTWKTLLEKIRDVDELSSSIDEIEEMLLKRFTQ